MEYLPVPDNYRQAAAEYEQALRLAYETKTGRRVLDGGLEEVRLSLPELVELHNTLQHQLGDRYMLLRACYELDRWSGVLQQQLDR